MNLRMNTIDASAQMLKRLIETGIKSDEDIWTDAEHIMCFGSPSTSAIRAVDADGLLSYPPFQTYFNDQIISNHLVGTGLKAVLWLSSHHEILGCIDKPNKCGAFTAFNWRDKTNYRSIDRNDLSFIGDVSHETILRRLFDLLLDCRKQSVD